MSTRMMMRGLASNVVLAVCSALYAGLTVGTLVKATVGWQAVGGWLYQYQGLVGGMATFLTVLALAWQLLMQREQIREQQRQQRRATYLTLKPEFEALRLALEHGTPTTQQGVVPSFRFIRPISDEEIGFVAGGTIPTVAASVRRLAEMIEEHNASASAGADEVQLRASERRVDEARGELTGLAFRQVEHVRSNYVDPEDLSSVTIEVTI